MVDSKDSLVMHFQGVQIEAFLNSGQQLKVVIDERNHFMQILGPKSISKHIGVSQKSNDHESFNKECLTLHDVDCAGAIYLSPETSAAGNMSKKVEFEVLKESMKCEIREIIIYSPIRNESVSFSPIFNSTKLTLSSKPSAEEYDEPQFRANMCDPAEDPDLLLRANTFPSTLLQHQVFTQKTIFQNNMEDKESFSTFKKVQRKSNRDSFEDIREEILSENDRISEIDEQSMQRDDLE